MALELRQVAFQRRPDGVEIALEVPFARTLRIS